MTATPTVYCTTCGTEKQVNIKGLPYDKIITRPCGECGEVTEWKRKYE